MKKLLLVLSVVAMASFLLVGCFQTTNIAPVITTTSLPGGTVGTAYTATVNATDADGDTLAFSLSGMPTGMVIGSATGVISGWTPNAVGTVNVTVTVTDGTDPVSSAFTITVAAVPVPEQDITIAVATEILPDADGKIFVKGGSREITVTFTNAVEDPLVKVGTVEVPVFSVDNKVFKGTGKFVGDGAVLVTVSGVCEDLCASKSVVVDSSKPYAELKAKVAECVCETGYALTITSDWKAPAECGTFPGCCGDAGSGLASWNIKIFHDYPWDDCCEPDPCEVPNAEEDGTTCPITITKECIDEVFIPDASGVGGHWEDFFDSNYWVVATLTDNVGNEMKYYGEVVNVSNPDGALGGELVSFVELHFDPTSLECTCYAEDPDLADDIIGDCDGTPTTACWEAPPVALECPEVIPLTGTVGEEIAIKLTFNRDVDEAVDGKIMAYISDAAKSTPPNIPDNALPLFLVQDADDKKVFTGEVTFDTPGSKVLYVLWDCDSCAPCMYEINVTPIKACPELAWTGAVDALGDGEDWLKGGETYTFTLTYDHVITDDEQKLYEVRIRDYFDIANLGNIFGDLRTLSDMTSTDNKVFTGTFTPPSIEDAGEYCTKAYVEVDILEDCCEPCMYKFNVDAELPYAETKISTKDCCGYAFLEFDSTQVDCNETCCVDECTEVVGWTIEIFSPQPIWDCCELLSEPILGCHFEGDSCPIDVELDGCDYCCLAPGTYWIVTSLTDAVGNVKEYYDVVTISGSLGSWLLEDTEYDWICDIVCDGEDSNPFIDGIPGPIEGPEATVVYGDSCGECLDECPIVILDPPAPIVGQLVTITFNYTDAVKPDNPAAYVGPAIKTLSLGIPEGSEELVLTQDPKDLNIYTAPYTFHQDGSGYIYVVDDCEDCTPCKYGVTVLPADVCPIVEFLEFTWWEEVDDKGVTFGEGFEFGEYDIPGYGLTNVNFTVTFANRVEKELVKVYVGIPGLGPIFMPMPMPPTVLQVAMTTTDEVTYDGTIPIGDIKEVVVGAINQYGKENWSWTPADYIDPDQPFQSLPSDIQHLIHTLGCIPLRIYVLAGDPCCIEVCEYPFIVDPIGPFAKLEVTIEPCTLLACVEFEGCDPTEHPGHRVNISTAEPDPLCIDEDCCGDTCCGVAYWEAFICPCYPYDDNLPIDELSQGPFDECCDFTHCDWTCEEWWWNDGDDCPVNVGTHCLFDQADPFAILEDIPPEQLAEIWGTFWYLYVEMFDCAGNITKYKARMTILTSDTPDLWDVKVEPMCEDAHGDDVFGADYCVGEHF